MAEKLAEFGFEVHEKVGPTGVVGVLSNGDGPVVLMRADMDALPVKEASGLDYASTETFTDERQQDPRDARVRSRRARGLPAGCCAVAVGIRTRGTAHSLPCSNPPKELGTGAQSMIDDGLKDIIPQPTVALSQHVMAKPRRNVEHPRGSVLVDGREHSVDPLFGRGSHGSMPHLSIDPVVRWPPWWWFVCKRWSLGKSGN